jgi:hypothetical protein
MEFNALSILKIEKKRNGGREGSCQVEEVRKEGGCCCGTSPGTVSVLNDLISD